MAIERNMEYQFMYYARYRRRKIYCFEQAGRFLEEDMEEALKDADIIAADPLYRPICPKNVSSMNFHIWHFPEEFTKTAGKNRRFLEVLESMITAVHL